MCVATLLEFVKHLFILISASQYKANAPTLNLAILFYFFIFYSKSCSFWLMMKQIFLFHQTEEPSKNSDTVCLSLTGH